MLGIPFAIVAITGFFFVALEELLLTTGYQKNGQKTSDKTTKIT